jgi:agmatine deiminase
MSRWRGLAASGIICREHHCFRSPANATTRPGTKIIEMPVVWHDQPFDARYGTSCGIYVNSVVTDNAIYVPQFGLPEDADAITLLLQHTEKPVIPIRADGVCAMGGSARCTVWHAEGEIADRLRAAARE